MDAVVIGSVVIDNILFGERLNVIKHGSKKYLALPYGSKVTIEKLEFDVGGSGHNVSVGLSKLGSKVSFAGKIGNDDYGKLALASFKKNNVDIKFLKRAKSCTTGFSFLFLLPNGEKTVVIYKGANLFLRSSEVPVSPIKNSKYLVFTSVVGNSINFWKKAMSVAKNNHVKILANPSITMIEHNKKDLLQNLKDCHIIIVDQEEARELVNTTDVKQALIKFHKLGIKYSVITLGKNGAIGHDGEKFYKKKAFNVKNKDTTGAGDAFTAGFLHWFLKTLSFEESIVFGNATAASNIKTVGAAEKLPPEKKVLKLIKNRW